MTLLKASLELEKEVNRLRDVNADLLAACEKFIVWADTHPRKCTFSGVKEMRDAISKAKGK